MRATGGKQAGHPRGSPRGVSAPFDPTVRAVHSSHTSEVAEPPAVAASGHLPRSWHQTPAQEEEPPPHPVCSRDLGSACRRPYSPASEACARLRVSRPSGPISICPRAARGASVGPGLGDSGVWTMAQPSSHTGSMQAWAPRKRSCVVFSGEDKHCPLTPLWCGSPCGAACPRNRVCRALL